MPKKSALKKTKATSEAAAAVLAEKPKSSKDVAKAEKKLKKASAGESMEPNDDESTTEDDPEAVEVEDDQTEALLKGFESDDEEENFKDVDPEIAAADMPELDKKTKKKLRKMQEKQAKQQQSDGPGVIYLGRIPHGFYENEMRQYFSQFGKIKNIRLSRNPKTGASKHYAFIEFYSFEVAEIVAKTMDNYLMFGHLLKCKIVPKDQVHDDLFIGANRRFKKVPWNKIEGRNLAIGKGETKWEEKIDREQTKRQKKLEALKKSGLVYDFDLPALKSAKDIPKNKKTTLVLEAAVDDDEEEETKALEMRKEIITTVSETISQTADGKKKKTKKSKVAVDGVTTQAVTTTIVSDLVGVTAGDVFTAPIEAPPEAMKKVKVKKAKKAALATEADEESTSAAAAALHE